MTEVNKDFTRAAYSDLLGALLERGYTGRSFPEADPDRPDLLLRHDIDLWPQAALELARIEQELGLSADYFFLLNSPLYDPAAQETRVVLHELLSLGHRIGLHFDALLYEDDLPTLNREASRECLELEALIDASVDLISFHRPARSLLGLPNVIAGRAHTYQPRFFEQIGYCSDSRGFWSHGHPLDHDAVANRRALQLLTHPVWWATDCKGDREAALACVVEAKGNEIKPAIAQTISGYSAETGRINDSDPIGT